LTCGGRRVSPSGTAPVTRWGGDYMRKHRLSHYLGIIFIAAVMGPAIVLSLLAIRATSHEEAYLEKQYEGTLAAEVAYVSTLVDTELGKIASELESTIRLPLGDDPSESFENWKRRSALVEDPFLLSPDHDILWPVTAKKDEKEASFVATQEAFFSDEVEVPVYENIAVAFKDDILADVAEEVAIGPRGADEEASLAAGPTSGSERPGEIPTELAEVSDAPARARDADTLPVPGVAMLAQKVSLAAEVTADREDLEAQPTRGVTTEKVSRSRLGGQREATSEIKRAGSERFAVSEAERPGKLDRGEVERAKEVPGSPEAVRTPDRSGEGEETQRQTAMAQFEQSPGLRQKVYEKAESEGQQVLYRNIETAAERREEDDKAPKPAKKMTEAAADKYRVASEEVAEPELSETERRLRSVFISRDLNFSEIVARSESGIIPRTIDDRLRLLYWRRIAGGKILGCLLDADELKERIIGTLPAIYSTARILTVLDETGRPLIVPAGHENRDWRRPFAAQEVSELLPRWEVATYLTDPDVISSRAQMTKAVMWILILILVVSIVTGGALVLRSASAEVKLAQQKTTFVANVSHELKTPLTSIRMFAEMLKEGRQADVAKQKHYLGVMVSETERLTRLINNVLDFSRIERGEKRYSMRECDIVEIATEIVENQRARLENNDFEVTLKTSTGRLLANADEEAIKQAIVNLLSNAEKYSTDTKQIEVSTHRGDGSAVIAISDRGVGIPPGEVEKIFAEFYRVDDTLTSKAKGAGLGLTIARRIVTDHGGDIRYVRRSGGGSTFEIVLPLIEE
jgi:signal transduction histidine kinase